MAITIDLDRELHKRFGVTVDALEPMWRAIRGEPADPDDVLATSAAWTMPTDAAPLLAVDEVAAVYALHCIQTVLMMEGDAPVKDLVKDDLNVRRCMRAAWQMWEERRLLANAVELGFGCDESAAWHTLRDIQDKPDVEAKMRKIAELAGAMHRAMSRIAKRVPTDDPQNVVGAEIGGIPERLLPAEIAKLADADLGDRQAMKVLNRHAHQRRMKGERRLCRGPLVLLLDESGSMHDASASHRGRNTWSKACAVALCRIAHADGRHVRVVHFDTSTIVQDVPPGDMRAMWEMAHSFMNGGTSIEQALRTAHREVKALAEEGKPGADAVLISDGVCTVRAPVIEAMKADGIALWSVAIGHDWPEDYPPRALAERYVIAHDRELKTVGRAVELAETLTEAATAREQDLN